MKKFSLLILLIILTSCSAVYNRVTQKTVEIGQQQDLSPIIYQTKTFKIFALQKITDPKKSIRIYFEGDGKTFINKDTISPNPTPTSYFTIDLVAQDHYPNIIYLARPCQFIEDRKCHQGHPEKYWTGGRFSKEVLDAIDDVVKRFSHFKLELIGYSGGATIAKYIAAKNNAAYHNIVNIRTIAGNIDNKKFSEIHNVKSIDSPADDPKIFLELQNIPQIHFFGSEDTIASDGLATSYLSKLQRKDCVKIIRVDGVTHSSGWQVQWQDLLGIKPLCTGNIDITKASNVHIINGSELGGKAPDVNNLKNSCDYKVVKKPEVKKHHNKKHHRHHHKKSHKKKSAKKNHEKKHEAKSELTPDLAGAPVKADILKSQNSPVANPNHKDSSNKKTTKDKKQSEKKADQKAAAKSHDSESVEAAKSMNTQSDSGKYNAAQEIIDAGKNSDDEVVEMNFADVNSAASSDKAARK